MPTHPRQFIQHFKMEPTATHPDTTKPGRTLYQLRVGGIYMTRLLIEPGITTGNYYHKDNRVMIYAESGDILARFEHIVSKERQDIAMRPGIDVVHVPAFIAHATKNIGTGPATIIFFSHRPIREKTDCYDYPIL